MTKHFEQLSMEFAASRGRWVGVALALATSLSCAREAPKVAAPPPEAPVAEAQAVAAPVAASPVAAPVAVTPAAALAHDLITGASPKPGDLPMPRLNAPKLAVPKGGEEWAREFANTPAVGELGGPRAGLTDQELIDFVRGRIAFRDGPGEAGGLGPRYIQKACGECHSNPVIGGEGDMDHALTIGIRPGEVEVVFVHEKSIPGFKPDVVPKGMMLAKSRAPNLLGVGLMDKIPPGVIASHADPACVASSTCGTTCSPAGASSPRT